MNTESDSLDVLLTEATLRDIKWIDCNQLLEWYADKDNVAALIEYTGSDTESVQRDQKQLARDMKLWQQMVDLDPKEPCRIAIVIQPLSRTK